MFIGNVLLLINIPLVGLFTRILLMPNWLLVPGILAISAVGVYSVHATTFDLMLMAGLGIAGYLLRKQGIPMASLILGFVLGELMEQNLRRALSITNGELSILGESAISKGLWMGVVTMLLVPPLYRRCTGAGLAAPRRAEHRLACQACHPRGRQAFFCCCICALSIQGSKNLKLSQIVMSLMN